MPSERPSASETAGSGAGDAVRTPPAAPETTSAPRVTSLPDQSSQLQTQCHSHSQSLTLTLTVTLTLSAGPPGNAEQNLAWHWNPQDP